MISFMIMSTSLWNVRVDGFLKFQRDAFPERAELFKSLASRQSPSTLFISKSLVYNQTHPKNLWIVSVNIRYVRYFLAVAEHQGLQSISFLDGFDYKQDFYFMPCGA
jgi:hypothetical protein